jgi:DNA modification methylase
LVDFWGRVILVGDVFEKLATLPANHVDCVVTSPPYWGLRNYGVDGQIGQEDTPPLYVGHMRMVFEQVRRVLKGGGTLWLNLGDSYARAGGTTDTTHDKRSRSLAYQHQHQRRNCVPPIGIKPKNLVGIPWKIAFALQADGWILRQDIIWHKPNPMPESVTDRCTRSHEYLFMFAKNKKYFYDIDAIKEPATHFREAKWAGDSSIHAGVSHSGSGKSTRRFKSDKQRGHSRRDDGFNDRWDKMERDAQCFGMRNKRDVWTVAPKPFKGAHFATFPPALIEPCILAGCPVGGTVLDPFFGAGTVGVVAKKHGRNYIGIELNPEYAAMAEKRIGA